MGRSAKTVLESKLQSEIVIWFSQRYPEKKGLLFSVRNTTFSLKDGQRQKALGMVAGVSDLVLIDESGTYALELKCPDKRHGVDHVKRQVGWGERIEKNGWRYFVITSLQEFKELVELGMMPYWNTEKIQKRLVLSNTTIRFNRL